MSDLNWQQLAPLLHPVADLKPDARAAAEADQGAARLRDYLDSIGLSVTNERDLFAILVGLEIGVTVLSTVGLTFGAAALHGWTRGTAYSLRDHLPPEATRCQG